MLKKFITTINRSIFVGERFERNIQNLLTESYIFIVLGVVIALLNFAKGEYRIVILSLLFARRTEGEGNSEAREDNQHS